MTFEPSISDTVREGTRSGGRVAYAVVGLILAGLVVTQTWAAIFAAHNPSLALALHPFQRRAGLELANRELQVLLGAGVAEGRTALIPDISRFAQSAPSNGPPGATGAEASATSESLSAPLPKAEIDAVAGRLRQLVAREPLNPRALRMLGLLSIAAADNVGADHLMKASVSLSKREWVAVHWMLNRSFEAKDFAATVTYADVLLRSRSQGYSTAIPVLARFAEDAAARKSLVELLTTEPPWRERFFAALVDYITDARTPLTLMLDLKRGPSPPTSREQLAYLRFLRSRNLHELAYYTWLQFLPPESLATVGYVQNGDFEQEPSGAPFDWTIVPKSGALTRIGLCSDNGSKRCLEAHMGGSRVTKPLVTQDLLLPQGRFSMKGRFRGETAGARGLVWRLACIGVSPRIIATSTMFNLPSRAWKEFEVAIEVPASKCRAQEIRLELDARSPSEQLISGHVWFDDLAIVRDAVADEPSTSEAATEPDGAGQAPKAAADASPPLQPAPPASPAPQTPPPVPQLPGAAATVPAAGPSPAPWPAAVEAMPPPAGTAGSVPSTGAKPVPAAPSLAPPATASPPGSALPALPTPPAATPKVEAPAPGPASTP